MRTLVILALTLGVAAPAAAQAAAAGRVKTASGAVFVVRKGAVTPAETGTVLYPGDGIRTGGDGRAGITLRDETRLSLGPNTDVQIDQFLYAPAQGRLGMALRIVRGMIAYVSGRIARLSPDAVRLETPSAILGVRGTSFVVRVDTP